MGGTIPVFGTISPVAISERSEEWPSTVGPLSLTILPVRYSPLATSH